ncbi:hypothetical protein CRUP_021100 [Coryphaenoides rupestris]|nr:hypothetical protein CRUP_021100 [Coryphaenoides rupestris]
MFHDSLMNSGRPSECSASNYGNHGNYGQSLPIPVPTQVHNYQRMEENLSSPRKDGPPRSVHTAVDRR